MISFIVIGKNEGSILAKCFESVRCFVQNNQIDFELIYVDSQSTDGSYEYANGLEWVESYVLEGQCNAAKARNMGASKAKGEVLFFVDGDMELKQKAYSEFFDSSGNLHYPMMTGNRIDVFYNNNWEKIGSLKTGPNKDVYQITTGGLFIIKRSLWDEVKGMDSCLNCFEDNDLAYRIFSKTNIKVLKKAIVLADHHTIRYTNRKRFKKIINSDYFLFRGFLYRKHFKNKKILLALIKNDTTLLALLTTVVISLLILSTIPLIFYIFTVIIKQFFVTKFQEDISSLERIYYEFKKDIKIIKGFINPPHFK